MLKGIDPRLSLEALSAIAEMGHGDELVIADANFPANSLGPKAIECPGLSATDLASAILQHFPLDMMADERAFRMEVVDNPSEIPPVCEAFAEIIAKHESDTEVTPIERFAFYERAKTSYVIFRTGELRLYGNLILKKGVIG